MPFTDDFGCLFNCGFCHTLVYECTQSTDSEPSTKKGKYSSNDPESEEGQGASGHAEVEGGAVSSKEVASPVEASQGKKTDKQVCDTTERFRTLFNGGHACELWLCKQCGLLRAADFDLRIFAYISYRLSWIRTRQAPLK